MSDVAVVQVSRLLDQRGLGSFQIKLLAWSFFMVLIDGYDITAIAFAAPSLVKEWGLKPGALAPVFSASLIGILFGSAVFGWIGDRYGRKAALIWSNIIFGVFTLAAAHSTDLTQMFWLRLLAGFGIGGVIPNAVAINAESAPRQMRATLAILAVSCVPLGGAIPGFVTAALVPTHGWQILFYIGGIVPIIIALVAWMGLPESIKYMALHEGQRTKMEATIKSIQPGYAVPANARFVIEDEKQFPGFNPAYLFHDGLALITPLVWLLFALNLMGYFFLISWTPVVLGAAKLPPATGALAGALLQVGGTVGAIGLCWWFQRHRFLALAVLFALAVPVVAVIGYAGMTSSPALLTATFFAGLLVLGIQTGLNGVGALIYPTSLRANGSGWQLGIGRIGSIVGPLAGALLIGWPVQHLYLWGAVPFLLAAVTCFIVHRLNTARLAKHPELREAQ
ncbi:MAG TPA: MFS transporter [Pseudolabrys sp.]|nr:MFS transporter [Pseudolabrys sp.]